MEYRIAKSESPSIFGTHGYWIEQKNDYGIWWMVYGTIADSAGEAWELLESNRSSMVTPEEIAMLLRGEHA